MLIVFLPSLHSSTLSIPDITRSSNFQGDMSLSTNRFSSDLLHIVLKRLNTADMLIARRVCKQWLEVIDEHKSFWRILHLPEGSQECGSSILDLFDRKSKSDIRDVQINWKNRGCQDINNFFQTLQKSRFKLLSFYLDVLHAENLGINPSQFPRLKVFKLLNSRRFGLPVVVLVDGSLNAEEGLKVLWRPRLLEGDQVSFSNLTSLAIEFSKTSIEWRMILVGRLSNQLKHLRLKFCKDQWSENRLTPLNFPRLKVLELQSEIDYPSWLRILFNSILVVYHHEILNGLPNVAHLWLNLNRLEKWERLTTCCPSLATLRIQSRFPFVHLLPFFLRQRRIKVEDGVEIDGITMTPIGALIVDFEHFTEEELIFFGTFVGEMIDSKKISNFVNMAI